MNELSDVIFMGENDKIVYNRWVEWDHFMIPNNPEWLREILRNLMAFLGHCMNCSALDGCYLVRRNMPAQPLHNRCDCNTKDIEYAKAEIKAQAECDIRKFTEYVFKDKETSKGKNQIFYDMGYTIDESAWLKQEYMIQALKQYKQGNYVLKNLDRRGQRLAIAITLKGKTFYSGWMLCPEGKIKNITPFGGWL